MGFKQSKGIKWRLFYILLAILLIFFYELILHFYLSMIFIKCPTVKKRILHLHLIWIYWIETLYHAFFRRYLIILVLIHIFIDFILVFYLFVQWNFINLISFFILFFIILKYVVIQICLVAIINYNFLYHLVIYYFYFIFYKEFDCLRSLFKGYHI